MEKIEKEIQVKDPYETEPMTSTWGMYPFAAIGMLIDRLNEVIDWINEYEARQEDGK